MGLDKEVVSYKITEMDVVKNMNGALTKGDFRLESLKTIEAVNRLLRESEKILPIIKYSNKK
jgi:hypothetical protein